MRIDGIALRGISTAVPCRVSRTADYAVLSEAERERFAASTGIHERRIVTDGQCASDLCAHAAEDLLARLAWNKAEVGALVMITQTGDYPVPATAIVLQHQLGLPKTCIAFDVNLGCSSYPYGLLILSSLMKTAGIQKALLLIGDVSSRVCHPDDKSSWPLFGDAGTATALVCDADASPMHFHLMNDGAGKEAIIIPSGGLAARQPVSADTLAVRTGDDGLPRAAVNLRLQGADIFTFAISKVPASLRDALGQADWQPSDLDCVVLHQANQMINDTIRKKVGYAPEVTHSSLASFGNTSSASVPLTLCHARDRLKLPARTLLAGFGVGLSWGAVTMTLPTDLVLGWVETDSVHSG